MWIPSHCGIEGNEIVDSIAKEHSSSTQFAYTSPIALDFNPRLKALMLSKWQSRWESGDMGRYTFSIYPQVGLCPWFLGFGGHIKLSGHFLILSFQLFFLFFSSQKSMKSHS
jgi:hypothetical protein